VNHTPPASPVSPAEARHIDQTCDRFEAAWKAGLRPRPEEYLGSGTGPARPALLRQLLLLDWDYRRRAGDDPRADDYHTRFPDDATLIQDVGREMSGAGDSTPAGANGLPMLRSSEQASDPAGEVSGSARYDLLNEVGCGGIGVVFRGRDRVLGRDLALKVLREAFRDRPEARRRFLDEARIGSRLQHPAIVPVYEMGSFDDGRPYFAMKLVEGHTLAVLLRGRADPGRDLARWLGVFEQVCQAVAYAHSNGVIHRDLKPANVMVGAFGEVQVMDWGFARSGDRGQGTGDGEDAGRGVAHGLPDDTVDGAIMGTPAYMPPEQARGHAASIDARADVFALGAILCEILTGRPPYVGVGDDEVCRQAAEADLVSAEARLDTCGADVELRELAKQCLAADRRDRPSDAGVVTRHMTTYLASSQDRLRKAQVERAAAEARAQSERRARRLTVALAAALGLLLAAGGAIAWYSDRQAAQRRARHEQNAEAVAALLDQCEAALRADRADQAAVVLGAAERRAADGGAEELAGRLARCRADLELLRELDDIDTWRWTLAGRAFPDGKSEAARWRAALASYGVMPDEGRAEDAAGRLTASLVEDRMLTALDLWLADAPSAGVRAVLRSADPDPYRDAVRDAVAARDARSVADLAGRPEALAQPARFAAAFGQVSVVPADRKQAVLESALRTRPGDLGLLMSLGRSYPFDRPEGAGERLRWFQAAVATRPRNAAAWNSLGIALLHQGKADGAFAAFQDAARFDPKGVIPQYNLANALQVKGDLDRAAEAYRKAIRIDGAYADAHRRLGSVLRDRGDPDGAVEALRRVIEIDGSDVETHINLGAILCDMKRDYDGAITCFKKAIRLAPKSDKAHYNLGNALWGKGDLGGAVEAYRHAIQIDGTFADAHLNLGNALRAKGDPGGAAASFREAIRINPQHAKAHFNLGNALWATGDKDGAFAAFREAARLDPKDAAAHINLGAILCDVKRDYDGAIAVFREAIRINPELARAHFNLGNALRHKGNLADAAAAYREAVRLDPKDFDSYSVLAWLQATGPDRVRDGKKAVEYATRACELTGWMDPTSIATLAAAYAETGDFDRAVEFQTKALSFPAYAQRVGKAGRERLELFARKMPYRNPALPPREFAPPPREAKP
jgi:tetratricopeptide (TPR) repeat protein